MQYARLVRADSTYRAQNSTGGGEQDVSQIEVFPPQFFGYKKYDLLCEY